MLGKLVATFAFMAFILPHEPDIGMGQQATFASIQLGQAQLVLFTALDKVRADLKANGVSDGDARSIAGARQQHLMRRLFSH